MIEGKQQGVMATITRLLEEGKSRRTSSHP